MHTYVLRKVTYKISVHLTVNFETLVYSLNTESWNFHTIDSIRSFLRRPVNVNVCRKRGLKISRNCPFKLLRPPFVKTLLSILVNINLELFFFLIWSAIRAVINYHFKEFCINFP